MARSPVYTPQPVSGPQQPAVITAPNMPARDLVSPTLASTQAPVTAPTVAYGGPMTNPDVARSSPGTPQPGPAVNPSPAPTWTWTPTASPCQTLGGTDLAAVSMPPGYAGPVATVPTSQMQDFGQPMGRTVGQPVDADTSQGGS